MSEWEKISLTCERGPLLVDGKRAIIPVGLQLKTVQDIHKKTHRSTDKIVETIRGSMIWAGWKQMIKDVCDQCEECAIWRKSIAIYAHISQFIQSSE